MFFRIVSQITGIQVIAQGQGVKSSNRLRARYGGSRWRKMSRRRQGVADVELPDGSIRRAEIHWYEAHGIGKRDFKIKRYLD
jgi:hypothetical protein